MKKEIIILVLIFSSANLVAGDGKSYISLKGSASMPIGKYSSKSLTEGCFTTTGFSAGVEGAWFFYKQLGAGLDVNFSLHPVDASSLATETVYDDQFMEDLTVRSDPYNIKTFMAGLLYRFYIYEELHITPKIFSGLMYGRTPFQLFEATYFYLGPHTFKKTESRDHGFAVKGGANIGWDINSCIGVGLFADFTYSKLYFGFQSVTGLEVKERNISYVDIGLNLIIKL